MGRRQAPDGDLELLSTIARDAELPSVADAAMTLAERIGARRFFVACVGQFKRGKSTVLNALVADRVLPTGVTPVTSVVTILRHGAARGATIRFETGAREEIAVEQVPLYVTEEHNHENAKRVTAVEVSLPATVLSGGLCLVDTPGIGSTFSANSEATRAFVPHIDAALVVLGADPPISGEELSLVIDVLAQVPKAIFVLNKADRLSANDVHEARDFTERVVTERLGRPIGPVLQVSATERLQTGQPTREWQRLEEALSALTGEAAAVLQHTRRRGITRLMKRLRDDLDERHGALVKPIAESETRIEHLERSVTDAQRTLLELGVLLAACQRRLLQAFLDRQRVFVETELAAARNELEGWIDQLQAARLRDRSKAFDQASAIARARIDRWLIRMDREADALYRGATDRFMSLANEFLARLTASADPAFATLTRSLDPVAGLREPPHFHATELMHLTAPGFINRIAHVVLPRRLRIARFKHDAGDYLERLLRTNTSRVVFDLEQRVEVSRRRLESELRFLLEQITTSASRALARARERRQAGQEAVAAELNRIDALRQRLDGVAEPQS
jgi:predicted GTPase